MSENITFDTSALNPSQIAQLVEFYRSINTHSLSRQNHETPDWSEAVSTGWDDTHVKFLQNALKERGKTVQLDAFNYALANNGIVTRDEIFSLGGYDPDRHLKNWTKPFRSIVSELQEEYGLSQTAALPLEADYTDSPVYRQAQLYRVAPEIMKLLQVTQDF